MVSLADVAGANSAAALSSTNPMARVVFLVATGGGTVRLGDSTVGSAKGVPFTTSLTLPYAGPQFGYNLGQIFAYVPTGTTLSIGYEPFD